MGLNVSVGHLGTTNGTKAGFRARRAGKKKTDLPCQKPPSLFVVP